MLNDKTDPGLLYPQCKSCCYITRNCTQEPCIVCDNGDEWVQSELDGQEEFDG